MTGFSVPYQSLVGSLAIVAASVVAIVSTSDHLSQTWDEPTHVASGMEWLQDGSYTLFTETPPLGRVATATGLYLAGVRLPPKAEEGLTRSQNGVPAIRIGNNALRAEGAHRRQLRRARAAVLPFFVLTAMLIWIWIGLRDPLGGFLAVAMFCTLPPILAHSGLATTDVALVAAFMLALFAFFLWIGTPSWQRSLFLGISLGLAVATKFITILFVPVAAAALGVAWLLEHRKTPLLKQLIRSRLAWLCLVLATSALTIWASYRFSVGTLSELPEEVGPWTAQGPDVPGLRGAFAASLADVPIPAPEFVHGLLALAAHNASGHPTYALGQFSQHGFWYFYLLALAVKTPLSFLLFTASAVIAALASKGSRLLWWQWGVLAAIPLILMTLLMSHVNIGLRHVLVVYALASLGGAAVLSAWLAGAVRPWKQWGRVGLGLLLLWQVSVTVRAYPHYLTYFNSLAGDDPGDVLVDSDLDWAQGLYDLEKFFSVRDVDFLHILYNGSAPVCEYDLPKLRPLEFDRNVKGWVALSERFYRFAVGALESPEDFELYTWLDMCDPGTWHHFSEAGRDWVLPFHKQQPVGFAGPSIRIYHFE